MTFDGNDAGFLSEPSLGLTVSQCWDNWRLVLVSFQRLLHYISWLLCRSICGLRRWLILVVTTRLRMNVTST